MDKLKKIDIKKIAKYSLNGLNFVNMILLGLIPIWNIPYGDEIQKTILVITGAISTCLLGNKAITSNSVEKINLDKIEINEESKENNIGIDEDEDIMTKED